MVIVDYYSRYYEYVVMTSTISKKVIDNAEYTFSHHGLTMDLNLVKMNSRNTESRMELCFSRKKANGWLMGEMAPYVPSAVKKCFSYGPYAKASLCSFQLW